jgi:hypothetical protein
VSGHIADRSGPQRCRMRLAPWLSAQVTDEVLVGNDDALHGLTLSAGARRRPTENP